MRVLRLTGIVIGVLLALIVVLLLAVKLFVKPNDFKPRIIRAVHDSTGRDLTLPGDLKLGVFPWISVEFGPATLSNPPGFAANAPFLQVQRVALRVRLLPLLRKELQVGRIDVAGLDLRLEKNARGEGNWQMQAQPSAPTAPKSSGGSPGTLEDLGGVHVSDSRLSYQDMVADKLNLDIGRFSSGVTTPVQARLTLTSAAGAAPIDLDARFDIKPDLEEARYAVSKLELTGKRAATPAGPALEIRFSAPALDTDLKAQTLNAPAFTAQLAQARVSGTLRVTQLVDAPNAQGTFNLEQVSPRELLAALGTKLPPTRDAKALTRLTAAGSFRYGDNAAEARDLRVQLDDSTLRGQAGISDLKKEALRFDLVLDQINFDRYRAPAPATPAAQDHAAAGTAQNQSPSALKTLVLDGALSVGSVTVANLKASSFSAKLAAHDGLLHIAPVTAQFYGGNYTGDISVDSSPAIPTLKLTQTMANVDVGALLKDLAQSSRVSGRGKVTTELSARGLGGDQMLGSLNGHATADLNNGAIEGLDLWFEINRAMSLIQKQTLPSGASSGRTKFDVFHASADITNGVAATKDLSIISQNLRVAGAGTVGLVSEALDYKVNATVLRQATPGPVTAANTLAVIPVNVSGTLNSPKVTPDLEGVAKARVQQELDKHKGELQQKLQDQLKNIFK